GFAWPAVAFARRRVKFVSCAGAESFRYRRRAERRRSIDADFHRLALSFTIPAPAFRGHFGQAKISREAVSLPGAAAPIGTGGGLNCIVCVTFTSESARNWSCFSGASSLPR